jgi:hypothetical protein
MPRLYRERPCMTCGSSFITRDGRYCSLPCRPVDVAARERREREVPLLEARRLAREAHRRDRRQANAHCQRCGAVFAPRIGKRYCGRPCYPSTKPRQGIVSLECWRCYEPFESVAANARYCSNACRRSVHKRQPAEHRRRLARERVRRLRPRLIERWGMTCYLCGRSIEHGANSMHPLALTIDHVMPVSAGGRDTEDNLRPAHRACNEDKGERLPSWWERRLAG